MHGRIWPAPWLVFTFTGLLFACKESAHEAEIPASESPQAKAVPAPLTTESSPVSVGVRPLVPSPVRSIAPRALPLGSTGAKAMGAADATDVAGDFPVIHGRADRELSPDVPPKDVGGWGGAFLIRTDAPWTAPRSADALPGPLEALRRKQDARMAFEITPTRARITVSTGTFLIPSGVELRFRNDLLGAIAVAPNGRYRVLPPGSLRTFFNEGRFDVVPLSQAKISIDSEAPPPRSADGKGARQRPIDGVAPANLLSHHRTVTTDRGSLSLDVARVEGAGEGGVLLCRFFLDLIDASPNVGICGLDEIPLRVELRLQGSGPRFPAEAHPLVFEPQPLVRRQPVTKPALPKSGEPVTEQASEPSPFAIPPPGAALLRESLSNGPGRLMASIADLEELHGRSSTGDSPGLTVRNREGRPFLVWFEGAPIASVSPGETLVVPGIARGRYTVQFRTFLGDVIAAPMTATVPGVVCPRAEGCGTL